MLYELAQANTTRVWVHTDPEFGRHEQNGQVLVHTPYSGGVDLHEIHGFCLQQLFEYHAILSVLACRDGHRSDAAADGRVPQNVIGARGLFDPGDVEFIELTQPGNRGSHIPSLVGVDRQRDIIADSRTGDPATAHIVVGIQTNFYFDGTKSLIDRLARQACELFVRIPEPTW